MLKAVNTTRHLHKQALHILCWLK